MARSAKANHYVVLSLLTLLAGCALPTGRDEPTSVVAVANPSRTLSAGASDSRRTPATTPAVSLVAYQAPADTPPEPPKRDTARG